MPVQRRPASFPLAPPDQPLYERALFGPFEDLAPARPIQASGLGPGQPDVETIHDAAARGLSGARSPLPHVDAIQRSFGKHDVTDVAAHTDATAREASLAMGAEAFASGNHVAFQAATPSLHTAAHEAAHVVQQRAGVSLDNGVGEPGDVYERHADAVADLVVQGRSAEALLDAHAGAAARQAGITAESSVQHQKAVQMAIMVGNADGQVDDQNNLVMVDAEQWGPEDVKKWKTTYSKVNCNEPGYGLPKYVKSDWMGWYARIKHIIDPLEKLAHQDQQMGSKRDAGRIAAAEACIDTFIAEADDGQEHEYAFRGVAGNQPLLGARLKAIVRDPYNLDQADYGLCGANAFLHSVCVTAPDLFARYVLDLIHTGHGELASSLSVTATPKVMNKELRVDPASDKSSGPKGREILLADWIALASLRSSGNKALSNIKRSKNKMLLRRYLSALSGHTDPSNLVKWYQDFGYELVEKTYNLSSGITPEAFRAVEGKYATHEIMLIVNAAAVADGGAPPSQAKTNHGDHWVRMASDVIFDESRINFWVWTWGKKKSMRVHQDAFHKAVFGYLVFKPVASAEGTKEEEETDEE